MDRHFAAFVLPDKGARLVVCHIARVAFGRHGQIDHGLRQCQLAFGTAQALVRQRRIIGHLHGFGVCQANVFPRHADNAPRQIARVCAPIQHSGEPIQRRIGMRATHRFMQR